jgi:Ca2+-binding RTX toxin-like protein
MPAPTLSGFAPSILLDETTLNAAPQLLDADVTFADIDGDFDGGFLTLSGLLAEDTVSVWDQGTGAGQIGLSGTDVTFGGVVIGTLAGGVGATLTITFNAVATAAAIDALIQNLTYANASDTPTAARDLVLNVTDAAGGDLRPAPVFTQQTGAANPFDGIDASFTSMPALVDLDGDGDLDLVVGRYEGTMTVFRNHGGVFVQDGTLGVSVTNNSAPTFGDLDGDGDLDLVTGEFYGGLLSFENDGGVFTDLAASNPFAGVSGDYISKPVFIDLDGHGDLDLVLGSYAGSLRSFTNAGGVFTERVGAANPFNGVDLGAYSAPAAVDLDGDGDLDLVAGEQAGTLRSFENDGGVFTELIGAANPFNGVDVGLASAPTFADVDGDGDLDLVVGDYTGQLAYFLNTAPGLPAVTVTVTAVNDEPWGVDNTVTVAEGASHVFSAADFGFNDTDGDALASVVMTTAPGAGDIVRVVGGTVVQTYASGESFSVADLAAGRIQYVADDPGASGDDFDTFTFQVQDDGGVADGGVDRDQSPNTMTVDVTPVNDAPALGGFAPSVSFDENTVNAAPQLLDADVTFADADFGGGTLTLSGLLAEDRASVRDQGTGAGQIGLSGADVTFGGVVIGTLAGGVGGTLTVTFNAAATTAAIDALIQNLTYANVSDTPTASRDLLLNVVNADGADLGALAGPQTFAVADAAANPFAAIDIGALSAPAFLDLDGDGDLDLMSGNPDGTLLAFENDGGVFTALVGAANPFDGVDLDDGTAPTGVDLDGDGDLDLVVGNRYGALWLFQNDGGVFVEQIGAADPFAFLDVDDYSTPALVDLDGDGDLDLVSGDGSGALFAFENDGVPFTPLVGAANPFAGVDVGAYSAPASVDLDGDGDLDLVIGDGSGALVAFENDGGAFTALTGAANPFDGVDVGDYSTPAFVDLDGDGDMDVVVGDLDGTLTTILNTTTHGQTITVEVAAESDAPALENLAASVSFDENTVNGAPGLLDLDVDFTAPSGDLDGGTLTLSGLLAEDRVSVRNEGTGAGQIGLSGTDVTFGGVVIGTLAGGVGGTLTVTFNASTTPAAIDALIQNLTYANVSDTPTASRDLLLNIIDAVGADLGAVPGPRTFAGLAAVDNPFNGVDIGLKSSPAFVDLDGDGDLDAVVGEQDGTLRTFENDGAGLAELTGAANPFDGIDVGADSAPLFADLGDDGDMDLVVGAYDGFVRSFENQGGVFVEQIGAANPFAGVSVFRDSRPVLVDLDEDGDADLVTGDFTGAFRAFLNEGGVFTEVSFGDNPLAGIDLVSYSAPTFADLDGDGDLDMVSGEGNGLLRSFENVGGDFVELVGAANPFDGVDLGDYATPVFADVDGDGDLDLVAGEYDGALHTFLNTTPRGQTITINVTAENDAPELTGFSVSLTVTEGDAPALLDADVSFTDADGDFDGGFLDVLGGEAEDVVSIRDQGMDPGQIGYDLDTGEVFYGGVLIGLATGGCGCAPLSVEFNADATAGAIDALIQNLTYEYQGDDPATTRTLYLSVMDADGAVIDGDARGFAPYAGPNAVDIGEIESYVISLIDFDGDGDLDMGVADDLGFIVYRNDGDASAPDFVADEDFAIADVFDLPTLIDVDDDGLVDVLFSGPNGVSFYRNDGSGFVEGDDPIEALLDGTAATAADYDGDGDLDLIASNIDEFGDPAGTLRLFENEGGGVFSEATGGDNPFGTIAGDIHQTFGDVDGDGDLDLFATGFYDTRYYQNDGGVFAEQTGFANPLFSLPFPFITLGDLTGDGFADFLAPVGYGTVFGENIDIGAQSFQITVNPVNDDPAAENNLGASVDEADSVTIDWTELSFTDPDNAFAEVTFTLTGLPANGLLMLDGVALELGDAFTQQDIDDDLLSYQHDGSETVSDNFQFDVSDGAGGSSDGHSFSFDITPVEDDTIARDDDLTTTESGIISGDVFADNDQGADTDPDGPPLEVIEVNGQAAGVGVQIVLASGALLTLRADGTFDYDPNGVFDDLTTPVTGASNSYALDGFTYTLAGGATATVRIEVFGEYDGGDPIRGGSGPDTLTGRYGDDTVIGGAGADIMNGGAGFDALDYSGSPEGVTVRLWQGFTSSRGDARGDVVSNFEAIIGSAFADTLVGSLGDDVLEGGGGADILKGFGGVDTASYAGSASGVTVNLGTGVASGGDAQGDTLVDIDGLIGSAFADVLTGDAGDNRIAGGAGADVLDGGAGFDTLDYSASAQGVTVRLWQGPANSQGDARGDVISNFEAVIGSAFADILVGTLGDNVLEGGAGADILKGFGGVDTASYAGSASGVTVNLATGVYSGGDAQGDTLADIDGLIGSAFADVLTGDAGDNVMAGGAGADVMDGGAGFDTLDYSASAEGVTVRLWQGFTSSRGDAWGDLVSNFEAIIGSAFADVLVGSLGDDVLEGGAAADLLKGFGGVDAASYAGSASGVTVNLATGVHSGGDAQGDTLVDIDGLIGSAFADILTGNAGDNILAGGGGPDILNGGQGLDTASYAGSASGVSVNLGTGVASGGDAEGDAFVDIENLAGSAFADDLTGNAGTNVLTGGLGDDTFVFGANWGHDVIADFRAGSRGDEIIRLDSAVFVDFADVLAHTTNDSNGNAVIAKGGMSITLTGTPKAWLRVDDFEFAALSPPEPGHRGAGPLTLPAEMESEDTGPASVIFWNDAMVPVQPFAFVTDAEGLLTGAAALRPLEPSTIDDWLW